MLLRNFYIEMNINFHLEKHNQHFSVTAFPKIVGNFLQEQWRIQGGPDPPGPSPGSATEEDILQYKDNIDDLTEKLLLLENVDFELSLNNKLVITMKANASTSQEK